MNPDGLRARLLRGEPLSGTFVKTPAYEMIEVLAVSGLDFACLDAEHAPQDRRGMDACLAIARALNFPVLVRVPEGTPAQILMALDSGATGVVVPHVTDRAKAEVIARAAHFGHGGRGFAGSTRWAGAGRQTMDQVLAQDAETIVLAQIEEPEGVAALDDIASVDGIDGLFLGPADMAVSLGINRLGSPEVGEIMGKVGAAAKRHGKAGVTFAPDTSTAATLHAQGISMFFIASEHVFMLQSARTCAADIAKLK